MNAGLALLIAFSFTLMACGRFSPRLASKPTGVSFAQKVLSTMSGDSPADNPIHVFSPNGKRTAYVGKQEDKHLVYVDGKKGERFDSTPYPTFSADSTTVAYIAESGGKRFVVSIGETGDVSKGEAYDEVWAILFSPSGHTLTYLAKQANREFVVIDGKKGGRV